MFVRQLLKAKSAESRVIQEFAGYKYRISRAGLGGRPVCTDLYTNIWLSISIGQTNLMTHSVLEDNFMERSPGLRAYHLAGRNHSTASDSSVGVLRTLHSRFSSIAEAPEEILTDYRFKPRAKFITRDT